MEFKETRLNQIKKTCLERKANKLIKIEEDKNFHSNVTVLHDAGYDSQLTGRVFIYLLKLTEAELNKNNTSKIINKRVSLDQEVAVFCCNKIPLNNDKEIPFCYIDLNPDSKFLSGVDYYTNVLFVQFYEELPLYELSQFFAEFDIVISKIHDYSFYVQILKEEKLNLEDLSKYYKQKYEKQIREITSLNQFLGNELYKVLIKKN